MKMGVGEGKKSAKCWAPHPSGPTLQGTTFPWFGRPPSLHPALLDPCFFCPVCHFLICPKCLFFCPECIFYFVPRVFAYFVPFPFFFVPVRFFLSRGPVTHDAAQVCQAFVFLQRMLRVVGTGKLLMAAKLEVGRFLHFGCVVCLQSLFFWWIVHANPWEAACRLLRSHTSPRFCRHHPQGQAPRSFSIGGSPSCSTRDRSRCFHAAAAVCLGRNRDTASRTACHSIIPKQFFSSTLILASNPLSEPVIHSS